MLLVFLVLQPVTTTTTTKIVTNAKMISGKVLTKSGNMAAGKKLVNGIKLFYDSRGNGSHALLCIPGAMGTAKSDFTLQVDHFGLRDGFKIVAFDPRGYRNSRRPPERPFVGTSSFENDAKDAKVLMDALGIQKFSVLGWSDGGITGLILASLFPDAVKCLVVWGVMHMCLKKILHVIAPLEIYENGAQKCFSY